MSSPFRRQKRGSVEISPYFFYVEEVLRATYGGSARSVSRLCRKQGEYGNRCAQNECALGVLSVHTPVKYIS